MVFQGKVTVDKERMKQWIEAYHGWPALKISPPGLEPSSSLRIGFPGCEDREQLAIVSWEEFFKIFEQENLAFLYQDPPRSDLSTSYTFL